MAPASDIFSPDSLLGLMAKSLPEPEDTKQLLKDPFAAIALFSHTYMLAVGFSLVGLGEEHTIKPQPDQAVQRLPREWNASSAYAFRYSHPQATGEFLLKVNRLGGKAIVFGIGLDDKTASFEVNARDYIAEGSLKQEPDDGSTLDSLFISKDKLRDLANLLETRIIARIAPGIRKAEDQDTASAAETSATAAVTATREQPRIDDEAQLPTHSPLQDDQTAPARPYPFNDPLAAAPRHPYPAGDFPPPGFEDEYDLNRPLRGTTGSSQPFGNIGERDLYPPGLAPHDPLRIGPVAGGSRGGGGMHPTFDDPLFGGTGGAAPFNPRAPPGARYDPIGPGDGPPFLRGGARFPGGGQGGGGRGGFGANPFSGFGSGDFIYTNTAYFDLDSFNETILGESPPKHPASKKRKGSPVVGHASDRIQAKCVFDLSSESDLLGIQPGAPDNTNPNSRIVFDLEDELDEITFTSSAPKAGSKKSAVTHSRPAFELSSDSLPDDLFQAFQKNAATFALESRPGSRIHNSFVTLEEASLPVRKSRTKQTRKEPEVLDEIIGSSPPSPKRKTKSKGSTDGSSKLDHRSAAASKKAEAQAQRAAEKAIKQREKEAKAKERELRAHKAEVNKAKVNKNETTADMIVEMSASLADTAVGSLVQEAMRELNVEVRQLHDRVNLSTPSSDDQCHCSRYIVRWKRKVNSEYDEDLDEWVPLAQPRCQSEKHILLYMTAIEFVSMLTGCPACSSRRELATAAATPDEATIRSNIDTFMAQLRSEHGDCIPILLIQDLDLWLRKKTNTRNREFTAAVRAQAAAMTGNNCDTTARPPSPSQTAKRRKKRTQPNSVIPESYLDLITPDLVASITLHLQLTHQPLIIQHTKTPALSSVEITKFTQHLSTRPGRLAFQAFNLKSASFCMETGQVRTGDSPGDVYARMLQAVQRVTPSMAYGIVSKYATVGDLVRGFKAGGTEHGRTMLQDVHKSMNLDGAWSDRKLGPMTDWTSSRLVAFEAGLLYARNLEERVKIEDLKEALTEIFSEYGEIIEIVAKRNVKAKGQAFIVFDKAEAAAKAVEEVNGFELFDKPMQLDFARTRSDATVLKEEGEQGLERWKRSRAQKGAGLKGTSANPAAVIPDEYLPPNKILFIRDLPESYDADGLTTIFSRFEGFKEVRMVPGRKGIAFVEYEAESGAISAKEATAGMQLGDAGGGIRVTYQRA
ncbi:hypothetical protein DV738_g4929, partial [Chaetothyriales sp. CBS 135597]